MDINTDKIKVKKPFFSIGITTYNRNDLLKQVLTSLLHQNFNDFEIIIGNDCLNKPLSKEIIGLEDTRIRIINNEYNLGELENMNSILGSANGLYFSWIFDDDLCDPFFLSKVFSALSNFDYPKCVFTSYKFFYGTSEYKFKRSNTRTPTLYSGKDFLRSYMSGKLRALGLGGFHKTDYLLSIGGAQRLSEGHMALYSEYLLLIRDGLLPTVVYINSPLVMVRVHNTAWSSSNTQTELFKQAGLNLIRESIVIFSKAELIEDFKKNLTSLLKSVISVIFVKSILGSKKINKEEIDNYVSSIKEDFKLIVNKSLFDNAIFSLDVTVKNIPFFILKARLKGLVPDKYLGIVHSAQYFFSRFTNKSF